MLPDFFLLSNAVGLLPPPVPAACFISVRELRIVAIARRGQHPLLKQQVGGALLLTAAVAGRIESASAVAADKSA